jgi:hypothetical protein
MAKIDRLGWAAGLSFINYGLRIGIRLNQPEMLDRLAPCLPPGWKPARSPVVDQLYSLRVGGAGSSARIRNYHLLYEGAGRLARTLELDEVFELLEASLQLYVAQAARRRIFVHAGVVGWQGRAIVIPGRSFSGKSTLVAALVQAGATYYSDEFAVFDAQGRVHPFSRPLSLRQEGTRPRRVTAETLGGRRGAGPLPVGLIAATEYREGARWRPRRLSPSRAALALLANTVPARRRPAAALATFQQAVANVKALKGARGEAETMVAAMLEHAQMENLPRIDRGALGIRER